MTESWFHFRFYTLIPLFFPLLHSWRAKVWSPHRSETPAGSIPKYMMGALRHRMSSNVLGYRMNEDYPAATVAIMTVPSEEIQGSSGSSHPVDPKLPCAYVSLHVPHLCLLHIPAIPPVQTKEGQGNPVIATTHILTLFSQKKKNKEMWQRIVLVLFRSLCHPNGNPQGGQK